MNGVFRSSFPLVLDLDKLDPSVMIIGLGRLALRPRMSVSSVVFWEASRVAPDLPGAASCLEIRESNWMLDVFGLMLEMPTRMYPPSW